MTIGSPCSQPSKSGAVVDLSDSFPSGAKGIDHAARAAKPKLRNHPATVTKNDLLP